MSVGQKEIGGRTFEFRKLPAAKAVVVGWKLIPLIPGVLKAVAKMTGKVASGSLMDEAVAAQPSAAQVAEVLAQMSEDAQVELLVDTFTSKISGDDLVGMMRSTFESVTLAGRPVDMDVHFGDGLSMDMLKVFVEALRVNFSGFLGASRSPSLPGGAAT